MITTFLNLLPAKSDVIRLLSILHVEEDVKEVIAIDTEHCHVIPAFYCGCTLRVMKQGDLLLVEVRFTKICMNRKL